MRIAPPAVHYKTVSIDDAEMFYRYAGPDSAPVIVLLHGFPSSSYQYRNLIPFLATRFRVIAPDYPGFGLSSMPARNRFRYTFAHFAELVDGLLEMLHVKSFALYMMDYGVPVGLRLALKHPRRLTAIVAQNGSPYSEAFGAFWGPVREFWEDHRSRTKRDQMKQLLTLERTKNLYTAGVEDKTRIDPSAYLTDQYFLDRPGNDEIQLDLFYDNRTNTEIFPAIHKFFRSSRPPALILWGENDPIFDKAGAEAYRQDLPDAEIKFIPSGHCALEDRFDLMAPAIHEFLSRYLLPD